LEVVREFPEAFEVIALAAGTNLDLLVEQVKIFHPKYVAIGTKNLLPDLQKRLAGMKLIIGTGIDGLIEAATLDEVDTVLTAVVGSIGIRPTLAAIKAGKEIALANKETLVAAGSVIIPAAQAQGIRILPVDSEHSAIFQCLEGRPEHQVKKLIITASGGPFRNYRPEQLAEVTVAQALHHPNWSMGGKITIDSATMFNKGLEIIEAHWLFNMEYDQITAVIHPESVIHSLVELVDGSQIAQLGLCDMRLPIQYALTYPERWSNSFPKLDLTSGVQLSFYPMDTQLFPAIELAYAAGRGGGSLPAVLNAANEVAVRFFLEGKIRFSGIPRIVSEVMGYHQNKGFSVRPDLDELAAVDQWAREIATQLGYKGGY
jgi:1-deoxy-D-xylulose-5-phosphate reductoisomerase